MDRTRRTARPIAEATLIAPDGRIAAHAARFFESRGVAVKPVIVRSPDKLVAEGDRALVAPVPFLFAVPSRDLCAGLVSIAARATALGRRMLAWSAATRDARRESDGWLVDRILEQRGALVSDSLSVLAEAARLAPLLDSGEPARLSMSIRSPDFAKRICAALEVRGVSVAPVSGARHALTIADSPAGGLCLRRRGRGTLAIGDPSILAAALELLIRSSASDHVPVPALPDVPRDEVDAVFCPPARLLSETTSKRVLSWAGLVPGVERLCRSANEAVRFASGFDGPAVVKLVKPGLSGKREIGAVRTGVRGASAVRHAVHSLFNQAAYLGPPQPLGVLVCRQVDGGARIWLKKMVHPALGLLVLAGPGDAPHGPPTLALQAPVSPSESLRAVDHAHLAPAGPVSEALADAIWRFSSLAHVLGPRLGTAEIHPLVAPDDGGSAMVLDALVEVA